MLPWWAASLVANVAIQWIEYANRTSPSPNFLATFYKTWPAVLLAQWALFLAFRGSPTWLIGWCWFTFMNCMMRVGASWYVAGEVPSWITLGGCVVISVGAFLVSWGARH